MKKIVFFSLVALTALFAKPTVSTTILPTQYFVKQIAGDSVDINTMVGVGADPHTYEPKPAQVKELEKSDLYFSVGIEFDQIWLEKIQKQYPNLKIIKTDDGIEKLSYSEHHHHGDHEHGEEHADHDHHHDADHDHDGDHHGEHEHHHGSSDPHIWTDPILVKTQAQTIRDALVSKYPQNKALYEANYEKFISSLDELDKYINSKLANLKSKKFLVYHPSWGYFAKRYGLEQLSVEIDGKEPKPKELAKLIDEVKEEDIKVVFVAPQFSKKSANQIAKETGAKVVEIDQLPLDWDKEIRKMADILSNQ